MNEAYEVMEQSVVFIRDSVWVKVHYVISNDSDLIEFFYKYFPINLYASLYPKGWLLEEANIFAKGKISHGFNFPV